MQSYGVTELPNYKVELKNINSFKFLEKAVNAEIVRQTKAIGNGEKLIQETRGYDEVKQITFSQRTKADAHDYRYFPEADLPPMTIGELTINNLQLTIPELPTAKRERFQKDYGISKDFADILVSDLYRANYFEESIRLASLAQEHGVSPKLIADMMINKKLDAQYPEPAGMVKKIVELTSVEFASNDSVVSAVKSVLIENEKAVKDYQNGNGNVIGFLIGMTQKKLQGTGNPKLVSETIIKHLQQT